MCKIRKKVNSRVYFQQEKSSKCRICVCDRYVCATWKYYEFLLRYHRDGERSGGHNKLVKRSGVFAICHSETETSGLLTWWNTRVSSTHISALSYSSINVQLLMSNMSIVAMAGASPWWMKMTSPLLT